MDNEKDTVINADETSENIPAEENTLNVEDDTPSDEEVEKEFIDEFAPEPIVIPNYNKEKEQKKIEKKKTKKISKNTKNGRKKKTIFGLEMKIKIKV